MQITICAGLCTIHRFGAAESRRVPVVIGALRVSRRAFTLWLFKDPRCWLDRFAPIASAPPAALPGGADPAFASCRLRPRIAGPGVCRCVLLRWMNSSKTLLIIQAKFCLLALEFGFVSEIAILLCANLACAKRICANLFCTCRSKNTVQHCINIQVFT